jgi:hypothetical protein
MISLKRMSTSALAGLVMVGTMIGLSAGTAAAATPTADYQFQNTLSSSTGAAPSLTAIGFHTNSFITDSVDGVPQTVLRYPLNNGVQLSPTTGVVGNAVYTIAVLVRIDDIFGKQPGAAGTGWVRLVDFKHGSPDSGLYDYRGQLNLYPDIYGTESPAPLVDGVYEMVVLTRDSTGLVTGYVNGVQQFSFSDTLQDAVIDGHNTLRFFRDNTGTAPNEASSGAVARIELFSTALSASDVAALTPAGAPTLRVAPRSGAPGTNLSVSGGGFSPGEQVNVSYKTGLAAPNPAAVVICSSTVSPVGTYSCSGSIPSTNPGTTGVHHIQATGVTSHLHANSTFTLL